MIRYLVQTMPMHDARIEEYINLHSTKNGFTLDALRPFMDEQSMEMSCLITMYRHEQDRQQKLGLEEPEQDPHPMELLDPHNETGWMDTIEQSNAMLREYDWDSCAVEFVQFREHEEWMAGYEDGYWIAVKDNNGLIIRSRVMLVEWSGPITEFIQNRDATGLVNYLIDLNATERRPGTKQRGDEQ